MTAYDLRISDWSSDVCSSDLELCDSVSEPAWWREIVEIYTLWPSEFAEVCSHVRVPVHYRQAIQDNLWTNDQEDIDRFARAFTRSPSVDCALVANSGHCIDFHLPGRSEEHTSELQSLMRTSYSVFSLKQKKHVG